MNNHVRVGQIINTQGVKGQVRIWPLTDDVERLSRLNRVFLEEKPPGYPDTLTITSVKPHKQIAVVTFQEITDMNMAEKLKGCYITIPSDEVPSPEEGSYYHFQLEGLEVLTEEGEMLGSLVEILETGSNDVYVVRNLQNKKEILIPALKSVVLRVDLENKKMTVRLPEGLR